MATRKYEVPWKNQPENTEQNGQFLGPFTQVNAGPYSNDAFYTEDIYGEEQTSNLENVACAVTVNKVYLFYKYKVRRGVDSTEYKAGAAVADIDNGVVGDFAAVDLPQGNPFEEFILGSRITLCSKRPDGSLCINTGFASREMLFDDIDAQGYLDFGAATVNTFDISYDEWIGCIFDGDDKEQYSIYGDSILDEYGYNHIGLAVYLTKSSTGETRQYADVASQRIPHDDLIRDYDAVHMFRFSVERLAVTSSRVYCAADSAYRELDNDDLSSHVYQVAFPVNGLELGDMEADDLTVTPPPLHWDTPSQYDVFGYPAWKKRIHDSFITSSRIYCVLESTITNGVPAINLMWAPFSGGRDDYFSSGSSQGNTALGGGTYDIRLNISATTSITDRPKETLARGHMLMVVRFKGTGTLRNVAGYGAYKIPCEVSGTARHTHTPGRITGHCRKYEWPPHRLKRATWIVRDKDGRLRYMIDAIFNVLVEYAQVKADTNEVYYDYEKEKVEYRETVGGTTRKRITLEDSYIPAPNTPGEEEWWGALENDERGYAIIRGSLYFGTGVSIVDILYGETHINVKYDLPFNVLGGARLTRAIKRTEGVAMYNWPLSFEMSGLGQARSRPRCAGRGEYVFPWMFRVKGEAFADDDWILRFKRREVL